MIHHKFVLQIEVIERTLALPEVAELNVCVERGSRFQLPAKLYLNKHVCLIFILLFYLLNLYLLVVFVANCPGRECKRAGPKGARRLQGSYSQGEAR